jgi:hypothetical protein
MTRENDNDRIEKRMTRAIHTKLVETVKTPTGEINVYRDSDGYHAERWDEADQWIDAQSGDCRTKAEAIERVS